MTPLESNEPVLLYVHIPFCLSKCHFCDWVTEIPVSDLRRGADNPKRVAYIQALKHQIAEHSRLPGFANKTPSILYWGGGTATILTESEIDEIMGAVRDHFDLTHLKEATIEGSPGSLTKKKLAHFLSVGFNRLSLGVQSFHDARLRVLGRTHDAKDACQILENAAAVGFRDISVDLICGLPGEERAETEESVVRALRLPVNHVALYPYRPAAGTTLVRKLRVGTAGALDVGIQEEAYRAGSARLLEAGFTEYAASHFGSPRCHSDMAYFKLEMDWLGFGSGATSLFDGEFLATRRGYLSEYIERPTVFDEVLPAKEPATASRLVYQALTTREGMLRSLFERRLRVNFDELVQTRMVRDLLETIDRITPLERDEDGIRIPGDGIAKAFIRLLFMNAPQASRVMTKPQDLLGYH